MPKLIGLTPEKAKAVLAAAGFDDGVLEEKPDLACTYEDEKRDLVPVGTICNQEIPPGGEHMSYAKVRVVVETNTWEHGGVAAGREWHRMVNVTGLRLDKARAKLREQGFTDEEFEVVDAMGSCGRGIVCDTRPHADIRKFVNQPGEIQVGK
ncbi:MAG TPA: PASTA domain-containing protein [Kofleriaceae bacterium]|nr:PASTA domain-containing protein [Kofleriaceae bacterium]